MNNYILGALITAIVLLPIFMWKLRKLSEDYSKEEEFSMVLLSFFIYLVMILFWPVTIIYIIFSNLYYLSKLIKRK